MGLNKGDLEKVPVEIGIREYYKRIFDWHEKHGEKKMKDKYGYANSSY